MKNLYKFLLVGLCLASATIGVLLQQHILWLSHYLVSLATALTILCATIIVGCIIGLLITFNNKIIVKKKSDHKTIFDLFDVSDAGFFENILSSIEKLGGPKKSYLAPISDSTSRSVKFPLMPDNLLNYPAFIHTHKMLALFFAMKNQTLRFGSVSKQMLKNFEPDYILQAFNSYYINYFKAKVKTHNNIETDEGKKKFIKKTWKTFYKNVWSAFKKSLSKENDKYCDLPDDANFNQLVNKFVKIKHLNDIITNATLAEIKNSKPLVQVVLMFVGISASTTLILIQTKVLPLPNYMFSLDAIFAIMAAVTCTVALGLLIKSIVNKDITSLKVPNLNTVEYLDFISDLVKIDFMSQFYFNKMKKSIEDKELYISKELIDKSNYADDVKGRSMMLLFFGVWRLIALFNDGWLKLKGLSSEAAAKFNEFQSNCLKNFNDNLSQLTIQTDGEIAHTTKILTACLFKAPSAAEIEKQEEPSDAMLMEFIQPLSLSLAETTEVELSAPTIKN